MMLHYVIKFKITPKFPAVVIGVLRFDKHLECDKREEALKRWAAKSRPQNPTLLEGESMWLEEVQVYDAD